MAPSPLRPTVMRPPRFDRPTGLDGPDGPLTAHRSTAILGMTVAIAAVGGLLAVAMAYPVASVIAVAVLVTLGGVRSLARSDRPTGTDRPTADDCGTCERA